MHRVIPVIAGLFLVALVAFMGGMWTTYKHWWPWQKVEEAQFAWRSYRETGLFLAPDTFPRRGGDAPDERHVVPDETAVAPGIWVINRFDPPTKSYRLEILDEEGTILSERPVDLSRITDKATPEDFSHAVTLLPDGSAMAVWDDARALARIDACGDPIWSRTDQVYHHSLEEGDDGFWTWQSSIRDSSADQRMVRFDPETGEILESIDLVDDVILKSRANELAMALPEAVTLDRTNPDNHKDVFHPNDVEELRADIAAAFPMFNAGDLLISLRNTNTVAVIDRKTHDVKWARYGPWQHQHDADFQADGTISVFSNYIDLFGSNIVVIDPATDQVSSLFSGTGRRFDSFIMGNHQRLPNGNWQINSSMQGRVMEMTPEGKIVRDYNNILDEGHNSLTPYAEHRAPGYLSEIPVCEK